jgi:hypothetical protein
MISVVAIELALAENSGEAFARVDDGQRRPPRRWRPRRRG